MAHRFDLRVYFEDTDLGGIVYYANYLKFIERARTEWVRACGIDQIHLRETEGLIFVVRRVEADYLRPAVFDDCLTVETAPTGLRGASITLRQDVFRRDDRLFAAVVVLVAIGSDGRAQRLPPHVRAALAVGQ